MRFAVGVIALGFATGALADQCDVRASRIAAEVGATVRTRIGPAIKLQHPAVEGFQIDCHGAETWKVSGGKNGPGPLSPAAMVIARTVGLTLETSEQAASAAMLKCIRAASGHAGTLSEATSGGLTVECYVLRDYVTMEVRKAARPY